MRAAKFGRVRKLGPKSLGMRAFHRGVWQFAMSGRSTWIREWSTIQVSPADDKFKCKKLTRNLAQSAL